jgi:RNA polymerase sigma factor (sigma-70 family)
LWGFWRVWMGWVRSCNASRGTATYGVMSSESDSDVLRRSIDEPDCFAVLFDRHFARLYRYLRRRLGDELAAELASETFLQAFRSRRRFVGEKATVLAWLHGIAANLVRMNHRSEERRLRAYARAAAGLRAAEPAIAIADRLDAEALGPALALALAELSPALREVLVLHAWAELSHEEIAAALGCSTTTVRTRLSRARSQLAAGLDVPITRRVTQR